jgi:hypothetical protein
MMFHIYKKKKQAQALACMHTVVRNAVYPQTGKVEERANQPKEQKERLHGRVHSPNVSVLLFWLGDPWWWGAQDDEEDKSGKGE